MEFWRRKAERLEDNAKPQQELPALNFDEITDSLTAIISPTTADAMLDGGDNITPTAADVDDDVTAAVDYNLIDTDDVDADEVVVVSRQPFAGASSRPAPIIATLGSASDDHVIGTASARKPLTASSRSRSVYGSFDQRVCFLEPTGLC